MLEPYEGDVIFLEDDLRVAPDFFDVMHPAPYGDYCLAITNFKLYAGVTRSVCIQEWAAWWCSVCDGRLEWVQHGRCRSSSISASYSNGFSNYGLWIQQKPVEAH